jgi:hypothetical protein
MSTDTPIPGLTVGSAVMSPDGAYSYILTRRWHQWAAPAMFVLLHPTLTVDGDHDDATVRRCVMLAQTWGYGAALLLNLYALRASSRTALYGAALQGIDPVGPQNDEWLARQFYVASQIDAPLVAAWGAHARPDRIATVLAMPGAARLTALGENADGSPVHPSHAEGATLTPWRPR